MKDGLNLLKGIATFLIVGCHLAVPTAKSAAWLFSYCQLAVAVFALISGYLLSLSLERHSNDTLGGLVVRRLKRLVPSYLVWTAVYLVVLSLTCRLLGQPADYLERLTPGFLVSAVLRGAAYIHLWFLADLIPFSVLLVVWLRKAPARLTSAGVCAAVALVILAVSTLSKAHIFAYDARLLAFLAAGVALRTFERGHGRWLADWRGRLALLLVPLAVGYVLALGRVHRHWLDAAFAVPLVAVCAGWRNVLPGLGRYLSAAGLHVYLLHPLVTLLLGCFLRRLEWCPCSAEVTAAFWIVCYAVTLAAVATGKHLLLGVKNDLFTNQP